MVRKKVIGNSNGNLFLQIGKIALELSRQTSEEEIPRIIADIIFRQYPNLRVAISMINPQRKIYKIVVLRGFDHNIKEMEFLLGKKIADMEFPLGKLSEENVRLNSNGRLNLAGNGIFGLAEHMIPKKIAKAINQLLDIDKVYTIGLLRDNYSFGNLTLIAPVDYSLTQTDSGFIETLAVMMSIAILKTQAYAQLQREKETASRVLEIVPTGIGMVIDRIFHDVNERVCQITGYDKTELIGKSAKILYPTREEYDRVGKVKYKLLEETGTGEIETVWKCRDGSLKNILLRSAAIDPANHSAGILFTALDITNRKETEVALAESEDRYRKLVENAPVGILIHQQGKVLYANQTILDLMELPTADHLIGTNALDMMHPDDREKAVERISLMYKTQQPAPVAEERFVTALGNIITAQIAASIIQYGGAPASLVTAIDVTGLKLAEQEVSRYSTELEEINNAKDKFFSIIAHDLKGPFNSILGFSDILFNEYDDYSDEERRHFIKNIASSAQNTYRLLENLLEWSRAQTNRLEFNPDILELSSVMNETILLLRSQAESKDIHLFSAVGFNTRVFADENMVKTIMRNLLSNAIKFSRRRGNVRIMERHCLSQDTGKEMIEILVKDDGIGMSRSVLDQLFRIDQMIRTAGTDNEKGTGLGLILCRELVLRNGGTIWAESEPETGTTLHFTIPKA